MLIFRLAELAQIDCFKGFAFIVGVIENCSHMLHGVFLGIINLCPTLNAYIHTISQPKAYLQVLLSSSKTSP